MCHCCIKVIKFNIQVALFKFLLPSVALYFVTAVNAVVNSNKRRHKVELDEREINDNPW